MPETSTPDRFFAEIAGGSGQALGTPDRVVDLYEQGGGLGYITQAEGDARYTKVDSTVAPLNTGSVLFANSSGEISEDNANLFWDNTNNRLGVGTNAPSETLTVAGSLRVNITTGEDVAFVGDAGSQILKLHDTRTALGQAAVYVKNDGGGGSIQFQRTITGVATPKGQVGMLGAWTGSATNQDDMSLGAVDSIRFIAGNRVTTDWRIDTTVGSLISGATHALVGSASAHVSVLETPAATRNFITTAQTGDVSVISVGQRTITSTPAGTVIPDLAGLRVKGPVTSGANATATRTAALLVETGGDNNVGIVVRQNTPQTNNLIQFQAPNGTIVAHINAVGVFRSADGTVSGPGISFHSDNDNGFYRIGGDNIAAAVGGTKILDLKNNAGTLEMGFFGGAPASKPTGVAVDAASIHAALVTLGLIAA